MNERVGAGNWESGQELGDTWASRNAFSYGRCSPLSPAPTTHNLQVIAYWKEPSFPLTSRAYCLIACGYDADILLFAVAVQMSSFFM